MPTHVTVNIRTCEADLQFQIVSKAIGSVLFDLVCKTLGIQEVWYFGLYFIDSKGFISWLDYDIMITNQVISTSSELELYFGVKFYPEDVAEDLIQEQTLHYFYLEVNKLVLSGEIYCPPEAALLLASYSVQSKYGDYDILIYKPGFLRKENLLPDHVKVQFQMSQDMWEDRIVAWYSQRKGLLGYEAELQYLTIAQDLEMYGVSYFEITNKRGTLLWLGVDSLGISVYDFQDKLTPKIAFPWNEIRNISFNDKKFVIKPIDKKSPDFAFFTPRVRVNRQILQLCIGNHNHFLRKRNEDCIEVQRIKLHAKEERSKRQTEKRRLRITQDARDSLYESKIVLPDEKSFVDVEPHEIRKLHLLELSKSSLDYTYTVPNIYENNFQIPFGKCGKNIEQTQDTVFLKHNSIECEIDTSIQDENADHFQTLGFMDDQNTVLVEKIRSSSNLTIMNVNTDIVGYSEIAQLKLEIQRDDDIYIEKSTHIQEQMKFLREHMESMKIREMMSICDLQHEEKIFNGENKYSTIIKVKEGTTRNRIAFFEEL